MKFKAFPTPIEGVKIIVGTRHEDDRGSFEETFNSVDFADLGLPTEFPQDNTSLSFMGTLRGLHIQRGAPQGKLVRCVWGSIFDVWVDLRPDSKTFKKWGSIQLSNHQPEAIWLPPGLAHGFFTMSNYAVVNYKCSTVFDKASDGGIFWGDKEIGIEWPFPEDFVPNVSAKDANLPSIAEYLK